VREQTGWELAVAASPVVLPGPGPAELAALRALHAAAPGPGRSADAAG
jgi:hypothetical protein